MKHHLFAILFITAITTGISQNKSTSIAMLKNHWDTSHAALATFEEFEGKNTILLNGKATVKGHSLANGIIEVDVYANTARSFAGIIFRKQNGNMEEVYMRLHKSRQVDAVQYTPTFNNESNWQLYKEYQANVTFKTEGWNKLKIVINNTNADVYVNNTKVLTIDNLRVEQQSGDFGLFALFNNRFANFKFTPLEANSKQSSKNTIPKTAAPGVITKWHISQAKLFSEEVITNIDFSKETYTIVKTETSGLLPISKYLKKPSSGGFERNKEAFTIATTSITSKADETKLFSFDYSDNILVYLNGKLIYRGNNTFRSKGPQYQGHLNINANKLYLNLTKGKNTIHCIVVDKANGWGLMGKIE